MKTLKLLFITIILLNSNILFAWDDIHEKPKDFKQPDKHRIFVRGVLGYTDSVIPELGELKSSTAGAYYIYSNNAFAITDNAGTGLITGNNSGGIEYRFEDKFRILYDSKTVSQVGENKGSEFASTSNFAFLAGRGGLVQSNYKINDWKESTNKFGIAYYHPFGNYLSVGAMVRNYDITQSFTLSNNTFLTGGGTTVSTVYTGFIIGNTNYQSKFSGIVPGIGIEIKPTRWFEIVYNYETVNLSGTRNTSSFEFFSFSLASRTTNIPIFALTNANQTYRGTIQTIDFVFKYTTWFSTRYGFTEETLKRNFDSYLFLSENATVNTAIINGIVYSALTESEAKFRSFNIRFEFSKGFN